MGCIPVTWVPFNCLTSHSSYLLGETRAVLSLGVIMPHLVCPGNHDVCQASWWRRHYSQLRVNTRHCFLGLLWKPLCAVSSFTKVATSVCDACRYPSRLSLYKVQMNHWTSGMGWFLKAGRVQQNKVWFWELIYPSLTVMPCLRL